MHLSSGCFIVNRHLNENNAHTHLNVSVGNIVVVKILKMKVCFSFLSYFLCSVGLGFLLFCSFLADLTCGHGLGLADSRLGKLVAMTHLQPEQVHISFGNTAQDMVVMWATRRDSKYTVQIADDIDSFQSFEPETVVLDEETGHAAKYIYRAYLSNLQPDTKYIYRIVGDSGMNVMFEFRVPTTTPKRVHSFMIFADLGVNSKNLAFLVHEANSGNYEAVFHVGDIAYNLHLDDGSTGDHFLKDIQLFAARVPYMTVPGDHERFLDYAHYR